MMNPNRSSPATPVDKRYRLGFRPDIEGLRAVAILLVVAAHAGLPGFAGGFVGVDVFFVISGYLISGLLLKELTETGRIRFPAFYARRLQRLLPALLLMIVVTSVLAAVALPPTGQPFQSIGAASAAVWLSNFHFALSRLDYFGPSAGSNLFLHTWSLGVEEQFYLIWPLLLALLCGAWGTRQASLNTRRLKLAMLMVATLSLPTCVLLTHTAPQMAFYLMPSRTWQFALGALARLYSRADHGAGAGTLIGASAESAVPLSAGWLGLAGVLAAGVIYGPDMPYPGFQALLPSLGTAAMLWSGSGDHRLGVSRCLSWRPLQGIGRVSYAWYLWHWPALLLGAALLDPGNAVGRAAAVAVSFVVAILSYRLVETPIRTNRRLLARPRRVVLAALASMVLVNVACIRWFNTVSAWIAAPQQQRFNAARFDAPNLYSMGCDDWYHSSAVKICRFGDMTPRHTVVLMGDSVGAQWFPAVRGRSTGRAGNCR